MIALLGTGIIWSGNEFAGQILNYGTIIVSMGFTLGIVFGLIALMISLPILALFAHRR